MEQYKISPEAKNKIVVEHHSFLDELEKLLLKTAFFSDEEKYEIMTNFQNRIQNKIESAIHIQTLRLNQN